LKKLHASEGESFLSFDPTVQMDALWDAPVGIALFDERLRFVRVNRALAELHGLPAAEHFGRTLAETRTQLSPDSQRNLERVLETGETLVAEVSGTMPRGPGDVRHWRVTYFPVRDGERMSGVGKVVVDITDVRRASEEARREAELLDLGDAFFELDRDWRVVRVNRNQERLFRRPRSETLGHVFWDLWPETADPAAAYWREYHRCMEERVPVQFVEYAAPLDLWTGVTAYPTTTGGIAVFYRDVSDRVRAQEALRVANEQLRESDRRKDEFLAVLSHELRNPLAPIRNSIFLLGRAGAVDEQARRARDVIDRQVTQLARLVDDLLDVTRISRGKIELRRGPVNMNDLVLRAGEDHRAMFLARGVGLRVDVPQQPLWVDGDAARLTQVVGNLLQNANKFTPDGGEVAMALAASSSGAEVHVRDTGLGIDPGLLVHIFDPFVQSRRTLGRTHGGLGLGLALVKGLTAMHGGSVSATSPGPGRGAEFVVRLPLVASPERRASTPARETASGRRHRVLVVDDNADVAESLAEVIRMFGQDVEVAHDGPTAVTRARAHRPDLILCDIGLPGMSGYEVARTLRADPTLATTRLVALSGYAQPEDRQEAADAGFDQHLAKPADPSAIEQLLH
jgi:PAS domain S-box-containing protein